MIPLVLVTGFLGSGKTTLLRRIAERKSDLKLIYLVNEFSPQDVDARLLEAGGLETVSIAGGSIFCQCRVTEFIQHLTMIPERFGANGAPVAGVVVEASGIADPLVIRRMLAETRLDETYGISAIVTVVDPKSFLKLVRTLPNILAQVEAADWVILNKIDQCKLEWLGAARDRSLTGEYAPCADPNYARLALRFRGPVDLRALETALRRAGDAVFRVKGFARVESGTAYVDYSAAGFHAEPKEAPHTGLECIVSAPRLEEVRAILADLPGTAID
jgi:G3E family GTPase